MAPTRTKSMELRAIRQQMQESPPPPPHGTTVREWFTGLALMNPELMKGLTREERVTEAIRLADELVLALAAPRLPSQASLAAPSEAEMQKWDEHVASERETKSRQERATNPDIRPAKRTQTVAGMGSILPPRDTPASVHFRRASDHLLQRPATPFDAIRVPGMGTYSSFRPQNNDE